VTHGAEITAIRNDSELSVYRNRTVGFVFQLFYLVPRLNILENVELPLIKRGTVGIDLAHKYPTRLSRGEQ